ncbi:hypothetical protein [Vibrio sp. D431a]|uniref:hypothetical protein n=1 Tax=Vibrio sp. D431a TaxID=2837388 RepID=UPI002554865A|nr:hypothetical protein [Vibrio sp. D431a]MDK9790151.1 hypothetical protein [Vibrio sp. D431a]
MKTINVKTVMTKEEYLNLITSFRGFVKAPENKPYKCKTYGTKYEGNVQLIHYVMYAVLRGKSPESTTHDVNSEKFIDAMMDVNRIVESGTSFKIDDFEGTFGLSLERVSEVLKPLQK